MGYNWLWDMIAEAHYENNEEEVKRLGKLLEDYQKSRIN